ncbi:MAG: DUF3179 domain-containing protein [Hyphomicrobiaceae bacterium]|nr:MAG: DUF3179 domain-containing protein [Hyphomicrobiaceae bacterium]
MPTGAWSVAFGGAAQGLLLAAGIAVGANQAAADPSTWRREGWTKTDFSKSRVHWREFVSGGPPKDGIPSIDRPQFKPAAEDTELTPTEPVVGLEIAGDARAYPLRILIWHEIVNDTVGGIPVAVTYCPLCNSAVVFDRRVPPHVLDFGTSGKLRNSDLVMYDRQTESWWQQFTGEAIVGAFTGTELKLVPARLESFAEFKARHPSGKLLVPNEPRVRDYGRNPYVGYDQSAAPFLYRGDFPKGIEPMARVVVVRTSAGKKAVALELLRKKGKLMVDEVELAWRAGQSSALEHWQVAKGRDVGTVTAIVRDEQGPARDVPYDVTFAFVVHAFHPDVPILKD